jgi:hypothetical protein
MNKPDSLRRHLLASVPALNNNPDRLLIFIDKGQVCCTAAASLSFEYRYELQVILTDFPGHPDSVILPLLGWLREHQSELLSNLDKAANGIQFEADVLDSSKVDLSLSLALTERVIVKKQPDGTYQVSHAAEPQYTEYHATGSPIELFAQGELLARWPAVPAPDAMALEVPFPGRSPHG